MRHLSLEELELIIGASDTGLEHLPTVVITGPSTPEPAPVDPADPVEPDIPDVPDLPSGPGTGGSPPPPPPPPCPAPFSPASRADLAYIRQQEGGLQTTGYALNGNTFPNSGVTIGRGVDLGTKSASQLRSWGVSQLGVSTLTPYLGYKGVAAQQIIAQRGAPVISTPDAIALSDSAEQQIFNAAITYFDSKNPITSFMQLPAEAQTVLLDISYNLGSLSKAPNFTSDAAQGNWNAAVTELRNWTGNSPDPLANRHNADANLLQSAITSNKLPSSGRC